MERMMWWLLPPVLGAVAFVRTSVKRIQDADLALQVRNLIMDLWDHCCTLPGKGGSSTAGNLFAITFATAENT